MAKQLGRMWRELSADGRAPYDSAAAADRARYLHECEAEGIDPGRIEGEPDGPLPPWGAIEFFKERSEVALGVRLPPMHLLPPKALELLRQGFGELPLEEREELEDLAEWDADRYADEVTAFQSGIRRRARAKRRKQPPKPEDARGGGEAAGSSAAEMEIEG